MPDDDFSPSTELEYLEAIYESLKYLDIHQYLVRQDMFIEELRSYLSQIIQLLNLIRLGISQQPQANKDKE